MKISFKDDWKSRIFDKIKIYSFELRDRQLINQNFDELHDDDKLFWINVFIFFNYSIFCVWKTLFFDERKNRVVVNIRDLNVIIQFDVYFVSLQSDIILIVRDCAYITIINCVFFFYQWRVHFFDRHKLTIINHKKQKSFNVIVMSYKNSSTYVQRQINRLLRFYCKHAKIYVDDIVIFSKILKEHKKHFRVVFDTFQFNNIFVKITKIFVDYFSVQLFDQKINFFELVIVENKLKVIIKLKFSTSFHQLETYFDFIEWLREYIFHYVDIFKSLQDRKIELLRFDSIADETRRTYVAKTRVRNSTKKKKTAFAILQSLFFKFFFLIHFDIKRQLFINLNASKKFDFEVMIYHVKAIWNDKNCSSRNSIESIFFFSRLLSSIETRYWFTKLKLIDVV